MALTTKEALSGIDNGRDRTGDEEVDGPALVACVVFRTRDPEQLVELLREAMAGIAAPAPAVPVATPMSKPQAASEYSWLRHTEAAAYLGVSKSTLYRYACQQKIECRKLGGRLEYRRSTLNQFKDRQIRPARRVFPQRGIISAALGSGK